MNLRVDLILQPEQRSASVINAKSAMHIGTVVGPLILVVFIALAVVNWLRIRGELNMLRTQWSDAEPLKKTAATWRDQVANSAGILASAEGWTRSRIVWHEQLRAIQKEIPDSTQIQLTRLNATLSLVLQDNKDPARAITLLLQGNAYGDSTENNVQTLRMRLAQGQSFTGLVDNAEVTRFEASPKAGSDKRDRQFQIEIRYQPRKF